MIQKFKKTFNIDQVIEDAGSNEINEFQLFKNLTPREADVIKRSSHLRKFKPGECVVKEGDAGVCIYLIKTGEAKVIKSYKNRQIELATLPEKSFFGEFSFANEKKRSATVVASNKLEVFCIFLPDLMKIFTNNPSIFSKFLPSLSKIIVRRINHTHEEINQLKS